MSLELAQTIMDRLEVLGSLSEEPDILVRRSYTDALRRAHTEVAGWMREAGMEVTEDQAGNLHGRYVAAQEGTRTMILGSHLDSVRDAGKYDGPLGILVALACVEQLHRDGVRLPFAVEVICFADEEGLRFTSYLGSRAVAGTFDPALLDRTDSDGITLRAAMRRFGADPDRIGECALRPEQVLGYCEVHIEQGPVLEAEDLPVGIVTGIIGQSRVQVRFVGEAGHAGTVPMALRHDALCAAAEFVLAVEEAGTQTPGLVATVGQVAVAPGASNVIPGATTLSLDVRHADDTVRERVLQSLRARGEQIASCRGCALQWEGGQDSPAVGCAPALVATLEQAVAACGIPVRRLGSGAGHDAVSMAHLTQIAMLFVRCERGISHNPREAVAAADVAVAVAVIQAFLARLSEEMH